MGDELYEVRNSLAIGNFHQTIAEGGSAKTVLKKPDELLAFNNDRDALIAKAQIGLAQYDAVINDLRSATQPSLVAVRLLAQVMKEVSVGADTTAATVKVVEMLQEVSPHKADVAVTAVSALVATKNYSDALKFAQKWVQGLDAAHNRQIVELRAACTDVYLRLNRPDLGEKEIVLMKQLDDESTLTILTSGLVALRQGGVKPDRFNDAVVSFTEIVARCGQSVMVLNLLALANLGQGDAQQAEKHLLDALRKKSGDPDTVANLVVVSSQLCKPSEATLRYVAQAKAAQPQSNWSRAYSTMEDRFREAVAAM